MRVISGANAGAHGTTLYVSDVSMPGHPGYEVEIEVLPEGTAEVTWHGRGVRPSQIVPSLADAINLAIAEGPYEPADDTEDE